MSIVVCIYCLSNSANALLKELLLSENEKRNGFQLTYN